MKNLRVLFAFVILFSSGLWAAETYDYESITVGGTAIGFTAAKLRPSTSGIPVGALITIETASIRFRTDGTSPTTTDGHLANAGDSLLLTTLHDLDTLRMIQSGTSTATVKVSYLR